VTGVSTFLTEIEPKRLGLIRELRPNATTIGVLVNPKAPFAEGQISDIRGAAGSMDQEIAILNASTAGELDATFAKLVDMRTAALLIMTDPFFFSRTTQLVVLTARHAIPTLYFRREFAAAGGLASYGSNTEELYRVAGIYAGRILKGEKPGDLPIQQSTKFVINLSTARALGLDLPGRCSHVPTR
jgi:putative tryptophan/tyrosine transport system substrate-binding protein